MIDIILLFGKLVLLALMYLFLFTAARTGVGLVSGSAPARKMAVDAGRGAALTLAVVRGPAELSGVRVPVRGPVIVGRAPEADIVIANDFVSARHARVSLGPAGGAVLEDLGSTNGTLLNGTQVARPTAMKPGDVIGLGTVELKLERS